MKTSKFLGTGISLILPTKSSPKVYLAIDSSAIAKQSFKLYNPFSFKAKLLKSITKFICIYFNPLAKFLLPTFRHESSSFIKELESKFNHTLHSSVYLSTANDKIVIQLQNKAKVIGYLKYAISPIGEMRVMNEKKAIQLLSDLHLAPELLLSDFYEQRPYIVIENIEGAIGYVDDDQYRNVLENLKKENKHKLIDHPRIINLTAHLARLKLQVFNQKLQQELEKSNELYYEVYEHGDFAPWNLIQVNNSVIAFDFEYFEEMGLQYLDEIKYHFQLNHLLNKKVGVALITAISHKIS